MNKLLLHNYFIILTIALLISIGGKALPINWSYSRNFGGSDLDLSSKLCVDREGNTIIVGAFYSSDFSAGSTILSSHGLDDMFIVKYDPFGNFLWGWSAGGEDFDYANSVAVDDSGFIYVTGSFYSDSIIFDTITLFNYGSSDPTFSKMFIVKYSPNGDVVWAKNTENNFYADGTDITVEENGDVLITGLYSDSSIIFNNDTIVNHYYNNDINVYILKLNSNGNIIYSKSIGGVLDEWSVRCKTDGNGNIYLFIISSSPTLVVDSSFVSSMTSGDNCYLVKLTPLGDYIWGVSLGGSGSNYGYSISGDSIGNTYLVGSSNSDTLFAGSLVLTNTNNSFDAFLAKYDSTGMIAWAKYFGGGDEDVVKSVAVNQDGGPTILGYYHSTQLIIDSDTLLNTSIGSSDIFMASYDLYGNLIFAENIGGDKFDGGADIKISDNGTSYICGEFNSDSISFSSGVLLNASNSFNIFFAKSDLPASINQPFKESGDFSLLINPNPGTGDFHLQCIRPLERIWVTDLLGRSVLVLDLTMHAQNNCTFTLTENGIYFVRTKIDNQLISKILVVGR